VGYKENEDCGYRKQMTMVEGAMCGDKLHGTYSMAANKHRGECWLWQNLGGRKRDA